MTLTIAGLSTYDLAPQIAWCLLELFGQLRLQRRLKIVMPVEGPSQTRNWTDHMLAYARDSSAVL